MAEPPVVDHDDQQVLIVKPKTQTWHVLRAGTVLRTLLQCKQRRKTRLLPSLQLDHQPFCAYSGKLLSSYQFIETFHSKRDFAKTS